MTQIYKILIPFLIGLYTGMTIVHMIYQPIIIIANEVVNTTTPGTHTAKTPNWLMRELYDALNP